ncbi:hypothetical protein Hanom_Chr14g01336361 [Helianthus anomalus]
MNRCWWRRGRGANHTHTTQVKEQKANLIYPISSLTTIQVWRFLSSVFFLFLFMYVFFD